MTAFADKVTERLAPRLIDVHGEDVTYTPFGGSPSVIGAIVTRRTLTPQPNQSPNYALYEVELTVSQAVLTSVNIGGDRVAVLSRVGGASKTYAVAAILGSDGGMWRLALR